MYIYIYIERERERDIPREHGLDKKFLYVHLGGHAEVRARESSLQGKFRQSDENGHRTNWAWGLRAWLLACF